MLWTHLKVLCELFFSQWVKLWVFDNILIRAADWTRQNIVSSEFVDKSCKNYKNYFTSVVQSGRDQAALQQLARTGRGWCRFYFGGAAVDSRLSAQNLPIPNISTQFDSALDIYPIHLDIEDRRWFKCGLKEHKTITSRKLSPSSSPLLFVGSAIFPSPPFCAIGAGTNLWFREKVLLNSYKKH